MHSSSIVDPPIWQVLQKTDFMWFVPVQTTKTATRCQSGLGWKVGFWLAVWTKAFEIIYNVGDLIRKSHKSSSLSVLHSNSQLCVWPSHSFLHTNSWKADFTEQLFSSLPPQASFYARVSTFSTPFFHADSPVRYNLRKKKEKKGNLPQLKLGWSCRRSGSSGFTLTASNLSNLIQKLFLALCPQLQPFSCYLWHSHTVNSYWFHSNISHCLVYLQGI